MIEHFPLLEVLDALTPLPKPKRARGRGVSALLEPSVSVPYVKDYVETLRRYAQTGVISLLGMQIRALTLNYVAETGSLEIAGEQQRQTGGWEYCSIAIKPPEDYQRVLSGEWISLPSGWEVSLPVEALLPSVTQFGTSITVQWDKPVRFRRSGWLRWWTFSLSHIQIGDFGGKGVFSGLTGMLVEPKLVWV